MRRWVLLGLTVFLTVPVGIAHAASRTDGSTPAPARVIQLVTSVPTRTLNRVGAGSVSADFKPVAIHGHLTSAGKPEVLSMNLAWCPHCAANSWALAVALSRFGTLTGLRVINTGTYYCTIISDPCTLGPSPCYPYTHGLSFLDAGYTSPYLQFAHVVLQNVHGKRLERVTRKQNSALKRFDPAGGAPALDVGGITGFVGSGYDPGDLAHMTWSKVARSLADPHTAISQNIDGLANLFTAAMCKATKGRPEAVCKSHGVVAAGDARHL